MKGRNLSVLIATALCFFSCIPVYCQTKQFWPESDTYVNLNKNMRLFFLVSITRENQEGSSAEMGPNIDFYVKPLLKLERFAGFQLDQSKSRPLLLRAGYRYLVNRDAPDEQRIVLEATGRFPAKGGLLFSDRNRFDLRFIEDSDFSWRYRNRITMEKNIEIKRLRLTPYARVEFYYDSNYSKWSRTAISAGCVFPLKGRWELEGYYEHQNDTSSAPNEQVDAIGFVVIAYF